MTGISDAIIKSRPGTYVHSIQIGKNERGDQINGYLGDVNRQIEEVCSKIAADEKLANGYHAIGFSQGGLFLRGVAQRCPFPPMKSLFTIGSPHGGNVV